jgi:protein-S-isoprenylcysteine O-methyltransferase Ste14
MVGIVNDVGVIIIVSATYYKLYTKQIELLFQIPSMLIHILGSGLFWWAFSSAGRLDFASSPSRGIILTEGPFALVRHPFYLSYIIIWLGCVVVAPTPFVFLGFSVLMGVYIYSAVSEERMLLESEGASLYRQYQSQVAMFFPKFTK